MNAHCSHCIYKNNEAWGVIGEISLNCETSVSELWGSFPILLDHLNIWYTQCMWKESALLARPLLSNSSCSIVINLNLKLNLLASATCLFACPGAAPWWPSGGREKAGTKSEFNLMFKFIFTFTYLVYHLKIKGLTSGGLGVRHTIYNV